MEDVAAFDFTFICLISQSEGLQWLWTQCHGFCMIQKDS